MAMAWDKLLCHQRRRPSTSSGDHRDEFERDYDRAIFSTPVKRLQDKAQVFPLDPNDAVRTRLTHSLEVSAVAKGLGMAVGKWLVGENKIDAGMDRWIEAICATSGLIHDLGNPPFGHSGEDAIRYWFIKRFGEKKLLEELDGNNQLAQDFLRFEGNAQTMRLVATLQILADTFGLNLTYGTLSASCKYIAPSYPLPDPGCEDSSLSKPGYFASEMEIVKDIRRITETGDFRNPLTYLVEAADDAVYSVADVEDAVKKGILSWKYIYDELKKVDSPAISQSLEKADKILKSGRYKVPAGLPDDIYAAAFRTAAIRVVVDSVVNEFKKKYVAIMNGAYEGELIRHCDACMLVKVLKKIGKEKVYCTSSNLKLELMGRKVICDLMDVFWEGAEVLPKDSPPNSRSFAGKAGALLSGNYCQVFRKAVADGLWPEKYLRLQLVTDYVCGMTDTFAQRLHSELFNG